MSIIQDALRRREQEAPPAGPERGPPTFPIPAPSVPEPPPPSPPSRAGPAPGARSKDRPGVVLLILLLAGVAAGGYWVARQRVLVPREADPASVPSAEASAPASRWGQALHQAKQLLAVSAQRVAETDAAVDTGAPPTPPADAPSEFQPVAEPVVSPPPAPPAPPPSSPPRPADARVRWPRFTVKGVIAPSGGMRGTVILNDETLQEGDYSEKGIRVVAVRGQEAFLEYEGHQRSYFAGQGER
jgi:hypothetical protein